MIILIKNIKQKIIIGPIINPIITLLRIKYTFTILKCTKLIGNITNCAEIVTDKISTILFEFITFSKKFFEIKF